MVILNEEECNRNKSVVLAINNVAKREGCQAKLFSTSPNGNCFFEAIALIINKRSPQLKLTSKLLRSELCHTCIREYFNEKVASIKTFVEYDETKFAEEWARRSREEFCLAAFSFCNIINS